MFLTIEEINTHLYGEQLEAISGTNTETLLTAAIDGAVAEAKGYLHDYDTEAIFIDAGSTGGHGAPEPPERNKLLVIFVKDIAIWHYLNLANPGTDLKVRQDRYKSAIAWLKSVQAGEVVPDLPKKTPTENAAGGLAWGSNPKRGNYI